MHSEYPCRKSWSLSQITDFFKSHKYSITNRIFGITGITQPIIGITVKPVLIQTVQLCKRFLITLSGWMYKLFFVHISTTYILSIKKRQSVARNFKIFKNFSNRYFDERVCYKFNNQYETSRKYVQNHCDLFIIFIRNAEIQLKILHFTVIDIIIMTTHC